MPNIPGKEAVGPEMAAALQFIEQFLWETGDFKLSARTTDHGRWAKCDGRSAAPWPELARILQDAGYPFGGSGGDPLLPGPEARQIAATGTGGGLVTRVLGAKFGTEPSNMPVHNHGGITGNDSPDHSHPIPANYVSNWTSGGNLGSAGNYNQNQGAQTGGAAQRHQHSISNDGAGSSTDGNQPPSIALNLFIHT